MSNIFDSTNSVKTSLSAQNYIASDEIATIVFLAQKLGKPLLAEGPAGVGKTELAKAIAALQDTNSSACSVMKVWMSPRHCTSGNTPNNYSIPNSCGIS